MGETWASGEECRVCVSSLSPSIPFSFSLSPFLPLPLSPSLSPALVDHTVVAYAFSIIYVWWAERGNLGVSGRERRECVTAICIIPRV